MGITMCTLKAGYAEHSYNCSKIIKWAILSIQTLHKHYDKQYVHIERSMPSIITNVVK
jgi:hypothetical protein